MIQAPDLSVILILLLFAIAYAVLRNFLFFPVEKILEWREQTARSASKASAEALSAFEQQTRRMEERLAQARREALRIREGLRAEGRASFEEKVAWARETGTTRIRSAAGEIEGQSNRARAELAARVAELARELAAKVLGRPVAA